MRLFLFFCLPRIIFTMQNQPYSDVICQRIRLTGLVQGVGMRPLVLRLAKELGLGGWVRNESNGLEIEVSGAPQHVETLMKRLLDDAPPNARIDALASHYQDSVVPSRDFFILESRGGRSSTMIGQDTPVCRDCLTEIFDPAGRRWRYPHASCSQCGPRYSICSDLPFDRKHTSIQPFSMCNKCKAEYQRVNDRRFRSEGNSCPSCGPVLSLLDASGTPILGDAISQTYRLLSEGKIVAIKGANCFHFFCDARNADAVALLRERKQRRFKPFSVMFANAQSAAPYIQFRMGEPGLLNLPERPVILLSKRPKCDQDFPLVAPNLAWLGVVLPFSPTHYLLFHEALGQPTDSSWLDKPQELALLTTSGNLSRETPAIANEEALARLNSIADAFLVHNYDFVTRHEDSIARSGSGGLQLIRRARGYTPRPIKFSQSSPTILAVGGDAKNSICIVRGNEAFVSQHIGDLCTSSAKRNFEEVTDHLLRMLEVKPALIVHDLNRAMFSTQFALKFSLEHDIPSVGIQHHHAHIGAVLAEKDFHESSIALALDGGGVGVDATLWGGELMRVECAHFDRLAHLVPLSLASIVGDSRNESRAPWRLAAAVLQAIGRGNEIERRFADFPSAAQLAAQLATGQNLVQTTSFGRIVEAVSALLGISFTYFFRDQASLWLESAAERFGEVAPLAGGWTIENGCLNLYPLLAALADEPHPERGAAIFHATAAAALTDWIVSVTSAGDKVIAAGNCMQNQLLSRQLRTQLNINQRQLVETRLIPTNDGGLALGQAWIAQHYLLGNKTKIPEQPSAWHLSLGDRRKAAR